MLRQPPLQPRKQATQARSARTVENILEAAARILEGLGFEGYTTNAIAAKAGVSIGSLYQYFPNKDAITIALIKRETARLLADVTMAAAERDWRVAIAKMVEAGVVHQLRRPRLAWLLDVEEGRLREQSSGMQIVNAMHLKLVEVLMKSQIDLREGAVVVAFDMMAITRGMTDMAGTRGETDTGALLNRVLRAVFRYVGIDKED
ncbi:TetR/AcrR family transcriptional regulator [Acidocella sp.]|uniref:TetR/AcrR family transcriptional regulator n=1 Tax=Acidocella sp. TaxID=50710 RepID=UPI0026356BF0|nr:TetR/AcrR family transcriptional regulator [Acidocella sp.]